MKKTTQKWWNMEGLVTFFWIFQPLNEALEIPTKKNNYLIDQSSFLECLLFINILM